MPFVKSLVISVILLLPTVGLATVTPLTACYIEDANQQLVVGENVTENFVIASLSKILTGYWALSVLGPDYRFQTKIYITPVDGESVDIHLEGSQDPFWGRETMHRLAAELHNAGVRKIRNLTADENFHLKWSSVGETYGKDPTVYHNDFVDLAGARPVFPSRDEILASLKVNLVPRAAEYKVTVERAKQMGFELPKTVEITKPKKVSFVAAENFKPDAATKVYSIQSLPLVRQLKIMNLTSNNYVADYLFTLLGGSEKFMNFEKVFMPSADFDNVLMQNGSGYPVTVGKKKFYNMASCEMIVRNLQATRDLLKASHHDLQDVMAVGGSEKSTLDKYEFSPNTIIGKTGSVNPVIGFAGLVSTGEGDLLFAYIMGTKGPSDWVEARKEIKDALLAAEEEHGGAKPVDYTALPVNLTFDALSAFSEASNALH